MFQFAVHDRDEPAFVDSDGWVLTQNVAILTYLADMHPQAALAGDGTPRSRAEVNRWLGMLNADVHKAFLPIFAPGRFLADEGQHDALKNCARAAVRVLLERIVGLPQGHIFHGELAADQVFFTRPAAHYADYRTPIRGLYVCGSSMHPGGGVSGIPGHNAAMKVLSER